MKKKITEILLQNFRNHDFCKFSINSDFVLFFGCNGIGKTSILEAISKLSPGSGLRSATNTEIARQRTNPWQIHFKFSDSTYVGSGFDFQKRFTKINDKPISCSQQLLDFIKVIWVTPKMNNIFTDQKNVRRAFFDRMLSNFIEFYLKDLLLYEKLKKERKEVLLLHNCGNWLDAIEEKMANICFKITECRMVAIKILQDSVDNLEFYPLKIELKCQLVDILKENDEKAALQKIKSHFFKNRSIDKSFKRTNFGVHLADFYVLNKQNQTSSFHCSAGEQKIILLTLIVACSKYFDIILMDDVTAHIDKENFRKFLTVILRQNCQIFFTDLSKDAFVDFEYEKDLIHL